MKINLHIPTKLAKLLSVVLLSLSISSIFGQTPPPRPAACNIGNGDGFEDLGKIEALPYNCTGYSSSSISVPVSFDVAGKSFSNVKFYFSVPNNFDLNNPAGAVVVDGQQTGGRWTASQTLETGYHYVIVTANESGKKLKKCQWVEVIDLSTPPAVDYSICDPTQVEIIINDDPSNVHQKYTVDWGGGTKEDVIVANVSLPYTMTRANTGQEVSVTGYYQRNNTDICNTLPSKINPSTPNVPYIDYLELTGEGDGVLLKFKNFTAGTKYQVEMSEDIGGGANWSVAGEATDGSTNIVGLDKNKKYCFRLGAIDKCGKTSYSPVVCSSNLSGTQGSSQSISLTWNKPSEPGIVPSRIIMEKEIVGCTTGNCQNRPYVNVLDTSLKEDGLDCQNIYAYQLTYTYKNADGKDIIIKSDRVEVNPKSGLVSITPQDLVTVGFMPNDDETVRIIVQRSDAESYNFFRAPAYSTDFVSIGTVLSNSIDDISLDPNSNAYCYKYEFEDQCGILSERSPEFCTVFLTGNSSSLNWTPYTFPQSVISNSSDVEYTVEFYDTNVNTWVPRFNTKDTSQGIFDIILNSKESQVKFRVQAKQFVTGTVSVGQFIYSYSNTVVINVPPNVFLPSAFTPNDDGINDTFSAYQKFIKEGSMVIYDRWGAILFETDDLRVSWDGTAQSSGNIVPSGNYAFRIKGISDAGETFSKTGYITLLR